MRRRHRAIWRSTGTGKRHVRECECLQGTYRGEQREKCLKNSISHKSACRLWDREIPQSGIIWGSMEKKMDYGGLLFRFTEMCRQVMGEKLTGVYLHGSAAMGCFHPGSSDLDLIVVVDATLSDAVKIKFMERVVELNEEAPEKGLELSVVKREFCYTFVYPTPFEVHFSAMHLDWFLRDPEDYVVRMRGTDKDLAAHFTILRKYGKVLWGAGIEEIFGEVPRQYYIDSIWYDVESAAEDILADPVYVTLNLCRVHAYLQEGLILSKKDGGEWGIASLPGKYRTHIRSALQSYGTGERMISDPKTAKEFADHMLTQIRENKDTALETGKEYVDHMPAK